MTSSMPALVFAFDVHADVGPPVEIGATHAGRRRVVPIVGGTFDGPDLRGRVLGGGADWQIVQADGFTELDSRYVLETGEGELIAVRNRGIRDAAPDVMQRLLAGELVDPSTVYFKTTPTFETAAPRLQWLQRAIFLGTGERRPSSVAIRFWRVV